MNLESLCADAHVRAAFQPYHQRGLALARVAASQRDLYHLLTERAELPAEPSGALWYASADAASMPCVGDWVAARIVNPEQAIIEAVLPRRSCFYRRAVGKREERQAIAANVDLVFLVCGLDADFNLRRLERYLTLSAEARVEPVIVLNKSDLCLDPAARTVDVTQTEGVFRALENHWRFTPEGNGARVDFSINFEFRNRLLGAVADAMFGPLILKSSYAFEARAKALASEIGRPDNRDQP